MNIEKRAAQIVTSLLENDQENEADDFKDMAMPPEHISGIRDDLVKVLTDLGVNAERIHNRYSDVYVMCSTYQEAYKIIQAGPWRSMAQVVRMNPEHPDARQYPWLADIPFANLGGYIASKQI